MVIPRSRSRSFESMTRSATTSFSRNVPAWRSMWSTSVVLPWSTWATMAMFRKCRHGPWLSGSAQTRVGCGPLCSRHSRRTPRGLSLRASCAIQFARSLAGRRVAAARGLARSRDARRARRRDRRLPRSAAWFAHASTEPPRRPSCGPTAPATSSAARPTSGSTWRGKRAWRRLVASGDRLRRDARRRVARSERAQPRAPRGRAPRPAGRARTPSRAPA